MSALPDPQSIDAPFGVDYGETDILSLDDDGIAQLREAVFAHSLLCFRRQTLGNQDLQRLAGAFGAVDDLGKNGTPGWETSNAVYISNLCEPSGEQLGSLGSGDKTWHADNFYYDKTTISFLYGLMPAPRGGRTFFAHTALGYRSLPGDLKQRAEHLCARYRDGRANRSGPAYFSRPMLFQTSSGERYLYVSERAVGIDGMADSQGRALLRELIGHMVQADHLYAHEWTAGDLLIYDNDQLIHRREGFEGPRLYKAIRAFAERRMVPVAESRAAE